MVPSHAVAKPIKVAAMPPHAAAAHHEPTLHSIYTQKYRSAARKFGKRAPGRNIVRDGVVNSRHHVRAATHHEIAVSIRVLRNMLHPPVVRASVAAAVQGPQPAGGSQYVPPDYQGGQMPPESVAQCESRGSYTAVNPSSGAYGKWQILPSTAAAHGCSLATPAGQNECAARIYATEGRGAWVC
jgi:plasmid stability protein